MESVRVAEMHAAVFLYADALTKFDHWNASLKDQESANMLRRMTSLWGFHVLLTYSDQGFKEGYLTAEQVKGVEREYLQVKKKRDDRPLLSLPFTLSLLLEL